MADKKSDTVRLRSHQSDQSLVSIQDKINKIASRKMLELQNLTSNRSPLASPKNNESEQGKVESVIGKINSKLKHKKVPQDVQFYLRNIKKFENLSSFIPSKGLLTSLSMPKIIRKKKHQDNDEVEESEFVDYMLLKQQKQRESLLRKRANKQRNSCINIYEDCWTQKGQEQFDEESEIPVDVDKQLNNARKEQIQQEKKDKELKEEKRIIARINRLHSYHKQEQEQVRSGQIQRHHILVKDEENEDDELQEIKNQAVQYRERSNKVIKMIQEAARKIYNKKTDQIQREMIMHQVERKMKKQRQTAESSKVIQNMDGNKNLRKSMDKNFFLTSYHQPNQRKISSLNLRMNQIVRDIDNISQSPTDKLQQLKNEQVYFQTLRETLQTDKVNETLKGLFKPINLNNKRAYKFNNKQFRNQIL